MFKNSYVFISISMRACNFLAIFPIKERHFCYPHILSAMCVWETSLSLWVCFKISNFNMCWIIENVKQLNSIELTILWIEFSILQITKDNDYDDCFHALMSKPYEFISFVRKSKLNLDEFPWRNRSMQTNPFDVETYEYLCIIQIYMKLPLVIDVIVNKRLLEKWWWWSKQHNYS